MLDRQRTDKELDALADLYLTGPDDTEDSSSNTEAMGIGAQRDSASQRRKGPGKVQAADSAESYDRYPGTRSTGLMTEPQPAKLNPKVTTQTNKTRTNPSAGATASPSDEDLLAEQLAELSDQTRRDEPTLRLVNLELESN